MRVWVAVIGCLVALGCGGDGGATGDGGSAGDAGAATGALTVFEPPETGPVGFLDVPFPSDLYLDADGYVDIGAMHGYPDYVANARIELSTRTAFCRNCTVTFPVEGDVDADSVPGDAAPDAIASLDDPLILMRADGEGGPLPLQVDYDSVGHQIILRARFGIVLDPGVRYVAAVTDTIRAADGSPLAPAPVFEALRDGGDVSAAGERARPMVEDALAALEAAGVARERVVSATIFTTEGDVRLLREVEAVAEAAAVPTITVDRVWTESELDDLFGRPTEDRPGFDIPPADGVGDYSIVHDAIAFVVKGTFESPRIVSGSGTDIGLLLRDDAGAITTGPTPEQIPWVLLVPKDVDLASVPVLLTHHGSPSNKRFAFRVGNTFARDGMAVFGYDAFQMGGRAASAKDEDSELRGLEGVPDGLAEQVDDWVAQRELGLRGAALGEEDRPDHGLGFGAQVALDVVMALRLLREGDLTAVDEADAALADLSFDPAQVYYMGQSFGGYVGLTVLPLMAGRVQAAVLMMGPPDTLENACDGPNNRPVTILSATTVLGLRGPFAEAGRRLCMLPTFDLARWLLEPFSPMGSLHFALEEPLRDGEPPDLLLYYAKYDELLGSASGEHVLGAAGVPAHGETFFTELPPLETPVSANFETPGGTITAGGWIWDSDHSVIRKKNTMVEYATPFYPPLVPLDEPQDLVNPIEDAHLMASHFFETRRTTGRAEIADPASL